MKAILSANAGDRFSSVLESVVYELDAKQFETDTTVLNRLDALVGVR